MNHLELLAQTRQACINTYRRLCLEAKSLPPNQALLDLEWVIQTLSSIIEAYQTKAEESKEKDLSIKPNGR